MLASQPSEPQVSERVGPEARLRSWVVWALAGIVALATVVSLVNLIERGRRPESPKALASTTTVTKTIAPSLPQQARAEIIQMREADTQQAAGLGETFASGEEFLEALRLRAKPAARRRTR